MFYNENVEIFDKWIFPVKLLCQLSVCPLSCIQLSRKARKKLEHVKQTSHIQAKTFNSLWKFRWNIIFYTGQLSMLFYKNRICDEIWEKYYVNQSFYRWCIYHRNIITDESYNNLGANFMRKMWKKRKNIMQTSQISINVSNIW